MSVASGLSLTSLLSLFSFSCFLIWSLIDFTFFERVVEAVHPLSTLVDLYQTPPLYIFHCVPSLNSRLGEFTTLSASRSLSF